MNRGTKWKVALEIIQNLKILWKIPENHCLAVFKLKTSVVEIRFIFISIFQIFGSAGPVKQLIKLVSPQHMKLWEGGSSICLTSIVLKQKHVLNFEISKRFWWVAVFIAQIFKFIILTIYPDFLYRNLGFRQVNQNLV